jgi:hypothetical protein
MTASALVLCAGIPRSGSTWLYNAVRLLLMRSAGESGVYGAWIEQYDPAKSAAWHVVKVHEPNESLLWRAKIALTSRRDLRDIAASAWKRGWINDEPTAAAFVDNVVRQHAFWKDRCGYEMVYETMRCDPTAELRRIANVLDARVTDTDIAQVSQQIDALAFDDSNAGPFDPATLLHKRHIADGGVGYHTETLPAALVEKISERYGTWLREKGYIT